jgi:hypothetical protein
VMSGVLFGVASETLLPPPHAPSVRPQSNSSAVVVAASLARGRGRARARLTCRAVPCVGRT